MMTAEMPTQDLQINQPTNLNRQSIQLKRSITVKTVVTDEFRQRAQKEMAEELKLIDTQSQQLEAQYQHTLQQLEQLAQQGQNVQKQLQQLNNEAQQKRNQLGSLKVQVSAELANLDKIENGRMIVTGQLENIVELRIGDNIYDKLNSAEVIIENGLVKSIRG